jgi:superfamily II DNA or RNA helicase
MTVQCFVGHSLRVRLDHLPDGAASLLMDALSIPNVKKREAQRQHMWGWESMPDYIDLWDVEDDYLTMPRGFLADFDRGMKLLGHKPEYVEERTWEPKLRIGDKPNLKRWQIPAVEEMLRHEQGIYKAPAGSGKTVAVLAAIQRLGCKSLVIVNTKDILWQWQQRVSSFLGDNYPFGQIGDNTFDVSPYITISTAQTLHSRFDELSSSGFFDEFSFVCLDECHHATAETYNRLMNRFSARYRIGVSATPDKTGDFALATNVLGPVFHTTKPEEVDTLQRPEVIRVPTDFYFRFKQTRSRWQKSNYGEMLQLLIRDPDRNELIVKYIGLNAGHHQLVISKRLEHLDLLEGMLIDADFPDPIIQLTGKESSEERQEAKAFIESEPCVLLSTLADEAMDIPRLDRMHLTFPQKNPGLVTQQVGRIERKHPDKTEALIYDYCDLKVGPLENQWRVRRREVYGPRGYEIQLRPKEEHATH